MSDVALAALRARAPEAIVVGASAGAVEALLHILPELPPSLPVPLLVVVHVPRDRSNALPGLFAERCRVPVVEAEDKVPSAKGSVYFAPAGYHLLVERGGTLALSVDDPVHLSRPSIDVLFESASYAYDARLLGILLSGANADGAAGLALIRLRGGLGWAQKPDTARVAVMPAAAIAAGVDAVLSPDEIGRTLAAWSTS